MREKYWTQQDGREGTDIKSRNIWPSSTNVHKKDKAGGQHVIIFGTFLITFFPSFIINDITILSFDIVSIFLLSFLSSLNGDML